MPCTRFSNQVEGRISGQFSDNFAVAAKLVVSVNHCIGGGQRKMNGADGFFLCASVGPGDPASGDSEGALGLIPDADSHGADDGFADSSMGLDQCWVDSDGVLFGFVGVGYCAVLKDCGGARFGCDHLADEAARA